jgi:hypothetical protein
MDPNATGAKQYQAAIDAGFAPQEVDAWKDKVTQRLREGGFKPSEIDAHWGQTPPDVSPLVDHMAANIKALPPEAEARIAENPMEVFLAGLDRGVMGLALAGKPKLLPPEHGDMLQNVLLGAGQFVGDLPATVAGWLGGASLGAPAGAVLGAMAGPEGAVPGGAIGAVVGAGAGSAALPEAIRSVLMDQYEHPNGAKDWSEMWSRASGVLLATGKAAIIGGVSAPAGAVAGRVTGSMSVNLATQAAAATAVGGALEGQVPSAQDFVEGAVLTLGFHAGGQIVGAGRRYIASPAVEQVAENQRDLYREKGIPPSAMEKGPEDDAVLASEVIAPHAADGTTVTPVLDTLAPKEPEPYTVPGAEPTLKPVDKPPQELAQDRVDSGLKAVEDHLAMIPEEGASTAELMSWNKEHLAFLQEYNDAINERDALKDAIKIATLHDVQGVPKDELNPAAMAMDREEPLVNVPSPASGMVRFFHGGPPEQSELPTTGGDRWVTPEFRYARDYRRNSTGPGAVWYIDLPNGHPEERAMFDEINNFHRSGKVSEETAKGFKPYNASAAEAEQYARSHKGEEAGSSTSDSAIPPGGSVPPEGKPPIGALPGSGEPPIQRTSEELASDILSRIGTNEQPSIWRSIHKFLTGFQAQLEPFNRFDRKMGLTGKELNTADMVRQMFASKDRAALAIEIGPLSFELDLNGGVRIAASEGASYRRALQEVQADGGTPEMFKAVRLALRTIELAPRGKQTGVDLNTAQQLVTSKGVLDTYKRGLGTIKETKDALIKFTTDSGVFSPEQAQAMIDMGNFHIVLRRIMDPSYNPPIASQGFGRKIPMIKKIKGSDLMIVDPDTAEMDNVHTMIALADKNRAMGHLIGLLERGEVDPSILRLERLEAKDLDTGELLRQQVLDEDGNVVSGPAADAMAPFLAARSKSMGPNDHIYYRNGRAELWRFHDEDLSDGMRAQAMIEPFGLIKMATGIARFAKLGITGALDFPLRAIFHGQIAGAAFAKESSAPYHDIIGGMMDVWNKSDAYQRWRANGGADSALTDIRDLYIKNTDELFTKTGTWDRVWNGVTHPLEAMRTFYHMVDAASRVGYMKRLENKGFETMKAVTMSRTAYLDHAEGRANSWLRTWASTVPFMEIGFKDIEQVTSAIRDRPLGTLMKASAWITAPSVINFALNWMADQDLPDADKYTNLPQWERDMYWVLPQINGVRMKIKKPYVGGWLFGTMPERFMEWLANDDPNAFREFGSSMAAQMLPPLTPQIISPIAEQWANKSLYSGRPLIKASMEKATGAMQYNPDTTNIAKKISQMLGPMGYDTGVDVSPIILENYVRSWAGNLPLTVLRAMDAAYAPPARPWQVADLPFAGAFFARQPDTSSQSIEDFYTARQKFEASQQDLHLAIQRGDQPAIESAVRRGAALEGLQPFATALRNLSAVITAIDRDEGLTNDEKRKRTDELVGGMIQISKGGMTLIKQFDEQETIQ